MFSKALFAAIGTASIFVFCDSMSAFWAKKGGFWPFLLMVLFAPLGYICFGMLSSRTSLSTASGLVNMFLLIGTVLVGTIVFKDQLSMRQYLGLAFAVLSIFLLAPQ